MGKAKSSFEPRDYRGGFFTQKSRRLAAANKYIN